jgi:hypothetical protein
MVVLYHTCKHWIDLDMYQDDGIVAYVVTQVQGHSLSKPRQRQSQDRKNTQKKHYSSCERRKKETTLDYAEYIVICGKGI